MQRSPRFIEHLMGGIVTVCCTGMLGAVVWVGNSLQGMQSFMASQTVKNDQLLDAVDGIRQEVAGLRAGLTAISAVAYTRDEAKADLREIDRRLRDLERR
jgi:hypothetical protein